VPDGYEAVAAEVGKLPETLVIEHAALCGAAEHARVVRSGFGTPMPG
jgi:hypothetical protein